MASGDESGLLPLAAEMRDLQHSDVSRASFYTVVALVHTHDGATNALSGTAAPVVA